MADTTVRRFRFIPPGSPVAKPYRGFRQPRPMMAVEEHIPAREEPHGLELRLMPQMPAGPCLTVKSGKRKAEWRPGQACVAAPNDTCEDIVAALVEFTWYESELRRLEAALAEGYAETERDLEFAYQIRKGDTVHRDRVTERMQHYAKLRLEFAQLDFFLHAPCGDLSAESKRWLKAFFRKADVEARAEAFSDQLELREEIYEAAADRFTDHWGWAYGHKLEITIIVLLIVEITFMATELVLYIRDLGE